MKKNKYNIGEQYRIKGSAVIWTIVGVNYYQEDDSYMYIMKTDMLDNCETEIFIDTNMEKVLPINNSYSRERIAKLIYCIEKLIKELKQELYDSSRSN